MVAGNPKLPAALVVAFRGANISVTTEKDNTTETEPVDPYVCVLWLCCGCAVTVL